MRALWKLSVIVLLGVAVQWGVVRWANEIDEAAFTLRVFCAARDGMQFDDPELVTAAQRLFKRQRQREGFGDSMEAREGEEVVVAFASEM